MRREADFWSRASRQGKERAGFDDDDEEEEEDWD